MNNKRVPPSVAQFAVGERAELLARIAEQAREIERLQLTCNDLDDQNDRIYAELAELKAQPRGVVPPTKAQGVVMPDTEDFCFCGKHVSLQMISGGASNHGYLGSVTLLIDGEYVEYTRLNAAPVQQASVPDERANFESEYLKANYPRAYSGELSAMHIFGQTGKGEYEYDDMQKCWIMWQARAMLGAAPAAPAADAGLVEALELAANRLDRLALEQGEFWRGYATAWADEARATANGVKS